MENDCQTGGCCPDENIDSTVNVNQLVESGIEISEHPIDHIGRALTAQKVASYGHYKTS